MTPTQVLKMLKSKIDEAGENRVSYVIETSDVDDINQAITIYDVVGGYTEKDVDRAYNKGFKDAMIKYRKD